MATYVGGDGREGSPAPLLPAMYYQPSLVTPPPLHVELIPHRIFVGGFASNTVESDLRSFFEKFGTIREVKIIKNPDGQSKGYAFITFETEEEAQSVRQQCPESFEYNGRRLNVGPAMRKIAQTTRPQDLSVMTPQSPLMFNPQGGNFTYPGYTMMSMDGQAYASPQTQMIPVIIPSQPQVYSPSPLQYPVGAHQPQQPRMVVPCLSTTSPYTTSPVAANQSSTGEPKAARTPTKSPSLLTQQAAEGLGQNPTPLAPNGHPLTPLTPGVASQVGGLRWQNITLPSTPLHHYSPSPMYTYTPQTQPTYVFTYPGGGTTMDMSPQYSHMYYPPAEPQMTIEVGPDPKTGYLRSPKKSGTGSLAGTMNQLTVSPSPYPRSPYSPYKNRDETKSVAANVTGEPTSPGPSGGHGAGTTKPGGSPTPPLTPLQPTSTQAQGTHSHRQQQ